MDYDTWKERVCPNPDTTYLYMGAIEVPIDSDRDAEEVSAEDLIKFLKEIQKYPKDTKTDWIDGGIVVTLDEIDSQIIVYQKLIETPEAHKRRMVEDYLRFQEREKYLEEARERHLKFQEDLIKEQDINTLKMLAKKYGYTVKGSQE